MVARRIGIMAALFGASASALAQGKDDAAAIRVLFAVTTVEYCTIADDLLRATCARVRAGMPEPLQKFCEFPAESFKARTAAPYAAFRQAFRDDIARNQASITETAARANTSFERQYAGLRTGRVSMLDLEALHGEVTRQCGATAQKWLAVDRKPR